VDNLPGRSLLPLLLGQKTDWRRYLFTEYTTHGGAQNFYPQRTVRNERFKLIENLLPDEVNPGYDFTNNKLDSVPEAVEAAPLEIRAAYERMRRPPRFELYDLQADSFEFCDLTANPEYAAVLAELQGKLAAWREQTEDPLLNPGNLARLKTEVYGITSKKGSKSYQWQYPDYFFGKKPEAKKSEKKKGRQVQ
jgi:N-sulfoglucosamine sulfohydrolase